MAAIERTVVTGAAGFAGGHLLDRLGNSTEVHGWALPGTRPASFQQVEWHDVDLGNRATVIAAIRAIQPTRLFHLAGAPSVETSFKNAVPHLSTNAMGTAYLLDAVREHAPHCRVLVVTSAQIYHPDSGPISERTAFVPSTPYGLTKLAQDLLALESAEHRGMDVVVARPFNHIGPRQTPGFAVPSFARQIARIERGLEAPAIRVGNLDTFRDFTDVRDVADAYCRIMERAPRGRAYNVCSGTARRIGDLLDALVGLSTIDISVETDPARLRPADVAVIVGDRSRLSEETGWRPTVPIDQTLQDTLDWWREETARTN
jgi:GDP-4-dehydro-6-deoxy-D-mannose reductase